MEKSANAYWAALIAQIRTTQHWSQMEFAFQVASDQATVSRWERGLALPQFEKQRVIEAIAERIDLASLQGIADIVNHSPFPMILTNQAQTVLAASSASGFSVGRGVLEQTPPAEHEHYRRFSETIADSGFWDRSGNRLDYAFTTDGGVVCRAVVTSVIVRGAVYAVVQQVVEPAAT